MTTREAYIFDWVFGRLNPEGDTTLAAMRPYSANAQVGGTFAHPVLVNIDMDNLTVTGNTFPVRHMMREFGLDWDKAAKAWTGSREILNALCVKYA